MKLIVYVMNGCATCSQREEAHYDLSERLFDQGVEFEAIVFGKVGDETYFPHEQHDDLCRKPGDPMKYISPVYILETDTSIVKLQDMGKYGDTQQYADYVFGVLNQYSDQ